MRHSSIPNIPFNALALLLMAATFLSCNVEKREEPRPNIVWITSEDNSTHYMKLFDENGTETPHIESLAQHGVLFNHAFSNAPVCSVARSTLISGCYAPGIGAQYHRKLAVAPMPNQVRMYPAYLRAAGYYTTNNSKEDYNLVKADDVWDESSKTASWRNRQEGQPFFHVVNFTVSHESSLHFSEEVMKTHPTETDLNSFTIQPNHPQTDLFRYTNAYYRDKIREMDQKVGQVISELKEDGLLDNTFIFYYGDHGGVLPGSKGYLYETGLHVPLVVHIPEKYQQMIDLEIGSTVDGFVSFIDFGPTVLHLAGVKVPTGMDGKPFMGKGITREELNARDETYSYADRFDEKIDQVRAVRKGKYKYIRSYTPFYYDGLMNNYRYKQLAYQEWQSMYKEGKLNDIQSKFFKYREPELLFDVENDPFEIKNLAHDQEYKKVLIDMREKLNTWVKGMPDLSFYPEYVMINEALDNPVAFGQQHQQEIEHYVDISNQSLLSFDAVKANLETNLTSNDPWERYWGLIVCSSFREQAKALVPLIKSIAQSDPVLVNKVRAAEYLGIGHEQDPSNVMTNALYRTNDPAEALLILNAIVLMHDMNYNYPFEFQLDKIAKAIQEDAETSRRLTYLGIL